VSIFRLGDQTPPEPQRVTDTVVMRFEHVYEVDPALMERTGQQHVPAWDTKRIVDSRWDHLDWMHAHFADEVLLAGEDSETMPAHAEMPSEEEAGPRPVDPDAPAGVRGVGEQAVGDPPVRE
jgi:uncharacterized damage-inducible protein DinB